MKRREFYRGIEDPISGTFKLADEISSRSENMLLLSIFALIFTLFGIMVMALLLLVFIARRNLFLRDIPLDHNASKKEPVRTAYPNRCSVLSLQPVSGRGSTGM